VNALCARALSFDVIDVPRIERMLKESRRVEEDGEKRGQLIPLPGRFARDPQTYATRSMADAATKKESEASETATEERAFAEEKGVCS
jgi:hypothetical protein